MSPDAYIQCFQSQSDLDPSVSTCGLYGQTRFRDACNSIQAASGGRFSTWVYHRPYPSFHFPLAGRRFSGARGVDWRRSAWERGCRWPGQRGARPLQSYSTARRAARATQTGSGRGQASAQRVSPWTRRQERSARRKRRRL